MIERRIQLAPMPFARTESRMRLLRLFDFARRATATSTSAATAPAPATATATATSKAAAIRALHAAIGADDFYARVARIDVDHAAGWMKMVHVQA